MHNFFWTGLGLCLLAFILQLVLSLGIIVQLLWGVGTVLIIVGIVLTILRIFIWKKR